MKHTKKLLTLVLAVVLVMSLGITAFADTTKTYTITAPATFHQYEIYQIFTGDLVEEDGNLVLSNVKWGVNGTGYVADAVTAVSEDILKELKNIKDATSTDTTASSDRLELEVITKYVSWTSTPVATITNGGKAEGLAAGYYLIKDKADTVTGDDTYTTYIVQIVNNVTITPKADGPELEKKVLDIDDATGDSAWKDSADYDIGDTISFKLTATLPSNYTDYKTYKLVFTDTFENMENVTITSVYPLDKEGAEMTYTPESGSATKVVFAENTEYIKAIANSTLTVTFSDLVASDKNNANYALSDSCKIVVEYTAKLSSSAVSGTVGNSNTVKLTYTNDPNASSSGTSETTEDKVEVFTYNLILNKVDQDNAPLAGAKFTLYKWEVAYDAEGKVNGGQYVAVAEPVVSNTETGEGNDKESVANVFTWSGLGDGKYKLEETTTPPGYNTIAPVEFNITADHDTTSVTPALTALKTDLANATVNTASGSITASLQNQKGSTLPATGGMGTTMFYTLGGILVLAAVVLLVTKKRMSVIE